MRNHKLGQGELMRRRSCRLRPPRSAFAGFRFPPDVIMVAVRWCLHYALSYRDVEELLTERGIQVDHVSVFRWVQRFTPLLIDAARPCRHAPGDQWFVDETYVKVAGRWVYLYRVIDHLDQVIDVFVAEKRDLAATRRFFAPTLERAPRPAEVSTDQAPAYPRVLNELLPSACHVMEHSANNRSYRRDVGYCLPDQAVGRVARQLLSGSPGRNRAVAGLAGPVPVVAAGRCTRCDGATWQHQARDICGQCGHSTQHEALEVRLVCRPI